MWNGKSKAVTLSFDDGVTQDIRLIEMLAKYNIKCTFNLNSSLLGLPGELERNGVRVSHNKVRACDVKGIYDGHEVAVHTLTHPLLPPLDRETVIHQVERDRLTLSELAGYEVTGMAYPCGGRNYDIRTADIIRADTGIKYARTIESSYSFDRQDDLLVFKPTVSYIEDCLETVCEKFLSSENAAPQLLYIWGHSYEMDANYISWEKFEDICRLLSSAKDVFFGTNREVFNAD